MIPICSAFDLDMPPDLIITSIIALNLLPTCYLPCPNIGPTSSSSPGHKLPLTFSFHASQYIYQIPPIPIISWVAVKAPKYDFSSFELH